MPDLLGKTVKARHGKELHAGKATGEVEAYDKELHWYYVEWDQGPPWRGWYPESELEEVSNA